MKKRLSDRHFLIEMLMEQVDGVERRRDMLLSLFQFEDKDQGLASIFKFNLKEEKSKNILG